VVPTAPDEQARGLAFALAAYLSWGLLPVYFWFTLGVHRLRLSTMGLVQYVAPSGQFLLAVLLYREPFGPAHAAAFVCIWASLALYSWDAFAARARTA